MTRTAPCPVGLLVALVVASATSVWVAASQPADGFCYNTSAMTVYYTGGFGAESCQTTGTCDNDTFYKGKNKDTTQDGMCIYTAYENVPSTQIFPNCGNWHNFTFNDDNSLSRFRNCTQNPGIDNCGSYHSASTY